MMPPVTCNKNKIRKNQSKQYNINKSKTMKKTLFAFMALAATFAATSCQSDEELTQQPTGKPMVINAVAEGIGTGTRAEMKYKYDIVWSESDEIYVAGNSKNATFTLTGGAGTTNGAFACQSSPFTSGDEVEAYYPTSLVDNGNLVWPAQQTTSTVVPMYSKNKIGGSGTENFSFASLGSVLQLNFNSTTAGIVLKSIEVKADEAMSGTFTIENGQAKVSQPEGDKPGITLDLGEGVTLGTSAKKFNIAIPAGEYNNLTITFIAKDGKKCIIHATKAQSIEYNTVNTLAISGEFKYHVESVGLDKTTAELKVGKNTTLVATVLPVNAADKTVSWSSDNSDVATVDATGKVTAVAVGTATITVTTTDGGKTATCTVTVMDALPIEFSVSADKKVHFSKGNLYYDGSAFKFETNQYDSPASWNTSHVSHFYWSKDASVATAKTYSDAGASDGDVFFTNADGFTVNVGGKKQTGWRTLSKAEWQYLFNKDNTYGENKRSGKYKCGVTVCGKTNCVVLLPDNWEWDETADEHNVGTGWQDGGYPETQTGNEVTWEKMEDAGAVCLPAAGYRNDSIFFEVGNHGRYWSSTMGKNYPDAVSFTDSDVSPGNFGRPLNGYSVRLVKE